MYGYTVSDGKLIPTQSAPLSKPQAAVAGLVAEVELHRAALHLERAPADDGSRQGQAGGDPVAVGMKHGHDAAPRNWCFAGLAQSVVVQRHAECSVEIATGFSLQPVDRAFQPGRALRQYQGGRDIEKSARADIESIGHVPVVDLHRDGRISVVAAARTVGQMNDEVAGAGVFRSVFREVILNAVNFKTAVADREQKLARLLGIGSDRLILCRVGSDVLSGPKLGALPTMACSAPFTYCTAPSPEALCFVGESMPTFSGGRSLPAGAHKVFSNDFACSTPGEEILCVRAAATGRDPGREKAESVPDLDADIRIGRFGNDLGLNARRYACRSALLAAAGESMGALGSTFGPFPGAPIGTRTIFPGSISCRVKFVRCVDGPRSKSS